MIKVLHIITDSNVAGAGHQLLALIGASDASAYTMEVVLPTSSKLVPLLAGRGIPYHEAPHIAEKSFSLAGVRTLHKVIKRLTPDIVHTHSSLSGRIAARLYGRCRVVHTRHSAFPIAGWRKRFPFRQLAGLMNNRLSDLVIAISPASVENLLDMGTKKDKIRMMFNGTAPVRSFTEDEVNALKEKYSIPPDVFVLAIMARLTEVKGHDHILDAAKAVPDVLILIAGDGERRAHLEERIAREGIANVRLLGFIENVDEIIAMTDVMLNASFGTEAASMSLIQGMSAGLPSVVSDYGGNPHLIQDGVNGLVTPLRDSQAMADAILRLKSDPELYRQMSANARRIYEERFMDKKMASDTEAVYREILER